MPKDPMKYSMERGETMGSGWGKDTSLWKKLTGRRRRNISWLDPEIKELVYYLNDKGFETAESCAGHPPLQKGYKSMYGWISFEVPYTDRADELLDICKQYGLTNVEVLDAPDVPIRGGGSEHRFYVTFSPLGVAKTYIPGDAEGEGETTRTSPEGYRREAQAELEEAENRPGISVDELWKNDECNCKTDYKETCFLRSRVYGSCLFNALVHLYPRTWWGIMPSDFGLCRLDVISPPCTDYSKGTYWRYNRIRREFESFCRQALSDGEEKMLGKLPLSARGTRVEYAHEKSHLTLSGKIFCRLFELPASLSLHTPVYFIEKHWPWEFVVARKGSIEIETNL